MLLSLTLDDQAASPVVIHALTGKRAVTKVGGLVGVSPVRRSVRTRPTGHGSIDETRYLDEALINVEAQIVSSVSVADAFAEFRAVAAPMLATLDGIASLLKWTEGASGLALQRYVKLASAVEPTLQGNQALVRYQAVLAAQDPRAYSQTLTTAIGTGIDFAGKAVFTNNGNRPTPGVFRVYGPTTGTFNYPSIENYSVSGGVPKIVMISTGVPSGSFLEVDVQARTIVMQVVATGARTNRLDLLDPALTTKWWELAPGATDVVLKGSGTTTGVYLDVRARSAYT